MQTEANRSFLDLEHIQQLQVTYKSEVICRSMNAFVNKVQFKVLNY
jgi:hypothetical protein